MSCVAGRGYVVPPPQKGLALNTVGVILRNIGLPIPSNFLPIMNECDICLYHSGQLVSCVKTGTYAQIFIHCPFSRPLTTLFLALVSTVPCCLADLMSYVVAPKPHAGPCEVLHRSCHLGHIPIWSTLSPIIDRALPKKSAGDTALQLAGTILSQLAGKTHKRICVRCAR